MSDIVVEKVDNTTEEVPIKNLEINSENPEEHPVEDSGEKKKKKKKKKKHPIKNIAN